MLAASDAASTACDSCTTCDSRAAGDKFREVRCTYTAIALQNTRISLTRTLPRSISMAILVLRRANRNRPRPDILQTTLVLFHMGINVLTVIMADKTIYNAIVLGKCYIFIAADDNAESGVDNVAK